MAFGEVFELEASYNFKIKLGTKDVVYLKLASFTLNKDVYVNRLESVFFDMKCVFDRTELNA